MFMTEMLTRQLLIAILESGHVSRMQKHAAHINKLEDFVLFQAFIHKECKVCVTDDGLWTK